VPLAQLGLDVARPGPFLRQPLGRLLDHLVGGRDLGGVELVPRVPTGRVVLERRYHPRQRLEQRAAGPPSEELACTAGIKGVVVVRDLYHPGPDERVLAEHIVLEPGSSLHERLGKGPGGPRLAVQQPADAPLQLAIGGRLLLPEEEDGLDGQAVTPLDHPLDRVHEVVEVEVRLAVRGVARKQVAERRALVDAGDLLRQEGRPAGVVVDPSRAENHDRDRPALGPDQALGLNLRLRVGPFRRQRPVLVDPLPRLAGCMHQHGAREHELADLEALQLAQKPACSLDGDGLVLWVGLAAEVVVGGQVDDGCEPPAVGRAHAPQRLAHAPVRGEIDPHRLHARGGLLRLGHVEAHDLEPRRQALG
jgi:hypothetical protein